MQHEQSTRPSRARIWHAIALISAVTFTAGPSWAQDAAKPAEVPFWAIGMPKDGPGKQMAPVPAYPVPTAADQLPVAKIKLPPGFKAEVWAARLAEAGKS